MTAYSVGPAWTEFTYTTAFGTHMMRVPTVPIDEIESAIRGAVWLDLRGGAGSYAWAAWAEEFAEQMVKMLPGTANIVLIEMCDFDGGGIRRVRQVSASTPFAGTDGMGGFPITWAKAVQRTLSFKCEDGSSLRLMLFDVPARTFDKASGTIGLPAPWIAFIDHVVGLFSAVASRKGGRPIAMTQISTTLNDNLRRKYGLN